MADMVPEFYKKALYHAFHGIIDIQYPAQRGKQNNLMFIRTTDGDYVAKFNTRDMVLKNCAVSRVANANGILTPNISAREYNGTWFESYPIIKGKTFFEHINDGMPMHAIKRAFDEILIQFSYMDNLPTKNIKSNRCINVHETAYEHAINTNDPFIANLIMTFVYLMNRGKQHNTGLYHSDITPKNVIVDKDGKLISFLDIDSMAICNRNYAFSVLADKWAQQGFSLNELYDKYEYMTGRKINRARINAMLNTVHMGKFIMFHTSKNKIK